MSLSPALVDRGIQMDSKKGRINTLKVIQDAAAEACDVQHFNVDFKLNSHFKYSKL